MKLQDSETVSLQDAFKRFRKKRMSQIKSAKKVVAEESEERADPMRMNFLRGKFVNQAMKYLGVPYAKRYHEKGSPEYDAPFFLDCCALVRRVLLDMKTDLGFVIGHWNQAYQYDTLPVTVEKEEDLKPGDLVFISGVYYQPKKKKQKHNMVHVEIWLGDGKKTIGARYHKGRVQIHDSYKFVSKNYHSMVYHFKSIDTWLAGVCQSFCPEHPWKRRKYIDHDKNSIFAAEEETEDESAENDSNDEDIDNNNHDVVLPLVSKEKGFQDSHFDSIEKNYQDFLERVDATDVESNFTGALDDDVYRKVFEVPTELFLEEASVSGKLNATQVLGSSEFLLARKEYDDRGVLNLDTNTILEDTQGMTIPDHAKEIPIEVDQRVMSQQEVESLDSNFVGASCSCIDQCACHCPGCLTPSDLETNILDDGLTRFHDSNLEEDQESCISDHVRNCAPGSRKKTSLKEIQQGRQQSQTSSKSSSNNFQRRSRSKSPSKASSKVSIAAASTGRQKKSVPKFYIGGHNGVALVEKPLLERGWLRINDNYDLSYYLKWVECKSQIDYRNFREGEQLVNHIPNGSCLTSKHGLMRSLQAYERINNRTTVKSKSKFNLRDFYPETYSLDSQRDFDDFSLKYEDGETWICKPGGLNQGKGIFLIKNLDQLKTELDRRNSRTNKKSTGRVISRYITDPLLLDGYKFDVRAYMLVASTTPFIVLYHHGYARLSCVKFSNDSTDVATHLTNQYVQKKHPDYSEKKNDTVWTFERLNQYINDNYKDAKGLIDDWVNTEFTNRIKEIMLICFQAVEHTIEKRNGFFDLFGFDFMIDENMKVWLIEVNVNPALFTNCESLQKVVPDVVEETLNISIEAFENKLDRNKVNPLLSVKHFQLLHDGEKNFNFTRPKIRKPHAQEETDATNAELLELSISEPDKDEMLVNDADKS